MNFKDEFISIYKSTIKRAGADELLKFLTSDASDFFTAPASTRFHCAYEGGLVEHSLNVYHCLKDYLERPRVKEVYKCLPTEESTAIAALLHDLCKINCYKVSSRNIKDENGVWKAVPFYEYDDHLPYGHGEKSVYIISGYMKLTREEAFAIRFHMGFSEDTDTRNIGKAFELFPLSLALSIADSEAAFFMEGK